MMASFRTVLLLFVGLQAFALISSVKPDDIGIDQDALNKTGDVCQNCTEKSELPDDMLSNEHIQNFFITCTICKHIIKTVERLLPIHRTEETVGAALKKACRHFPFGIAHVCDGIVEKYFKKVVDLLLKDVAPTAICIAIDMCGLFKESFVEKLEICSPPFSGIHDDALRMLNSTNQGPKPRRVRV